MKNLLDKRISTRIKFKYFSKGLMVFKAAPYYNRRTTWMKLIFTCSFNKRELFKLNIIHNHIIVSINLDI